MAWYVTRPFQLPVSQLSLAQLVERWTVNGFLIGQLVSIGRWLTPSRMSLLVFTMFLYEHFSIPVNPLVDNLTKLLELVYSPMSIGLTFSSAMSKFIVQPRRLVDRHLT